MIVVSKEELISTYIIFTNDRNFFKKRKVNVVYKVRATYLFVCTKQIYSWNTNTNDIVLLHGYNSAADAKRAIKQLMPTKVELNTY